ncbi:trypsin-1-like [Epargyreus clarus]|uniref:trypsin-1-like n=1 Tax=Epargyreus clarus TaxID=520877 RepID=UPI003C2D88AA
MFRFSLYFVVLICALSCQGQSEGESCNIDGVAGVCKLITQCPKALEDITKHNKRPKICGFVGTDPVVCCIPSTPAATPPPPTRPPPPPVVTTQRPVATPAAPIRGPTTEYTPQLYDYVDEDSPTEKCRPIPANETALKTGQKAWDKCIEYQEQYVFPCEKSKVLVGGGSNARGNNCKHNVNQLVIGGVAATTGEFPHMALLGFGEQSPEAFPCGGSVISENYILTAGHCTSTKDLGPVAYALVGTLKRSGDYDRENLYNIKKIIKHPDYAPPQKYHDIALLQTHKRMKLNQFVVPACLDTGNQEAEEVLATGWGATANRGASADVLQKVKLSKFSQEECAMYFPTERLMKRGFDPKTQTCYGDKNQSKDTCQGDSGGPLQIKSKRMKCMYVVVGVTSFGRACGFIGQPGIYTRVVDYLPWIESIVWP